ncbi:hypothetical protein BN2476_210141 [Paraburkholderia piptadeniae]|uniref:Uncharacterized protein n=1 Tax=Paraburkholderia piptadeniae TaxID=1701573 RepID=A0A1N7RW49_9BURK|nr:hypothetical protein BN2476_210141 [Paraburkholderia piptadeniae]
MADGARQDRERLVPATRELMTELSRYRQSLGMTAPPSRSEATRSCSRSDKLQVALQEKQQAARLEPRHRPPDGSYLHVVTIAGIRKPTRSTASTVKQIRSEPESRRTAQDGCRCFHI